jgi:hypothetical protein
VTDDRADGRCALVADDLAAVAVGAATGQERARVLHHLETCAHCATALDGLAATGDRLAGLAPEVDPPPGFADRTVERMVRSGSPAAARGPAPGAASSRRVVAAVVAALVILCGAAVGELVATAGSSTDPGARASAGAHVVPLRSTTGATGTVMVVTSRDHGSSWVAMTVDAPAAPPTVRCDIVLADGTTSTIGHFRLAAGYGSWVIPVPVPADTVRGVRLVGAGGTVVASATTA